MTNADREQIGELLSAYLDGELDVEQRLAVERRLQEDESARRQLEEMRRVVGLLGSLPRREAPTSIAAEIESHVERSALLELEREVDAPSPTRRSPVWPALSMAAMLALVAVGLWYIREESFIAPSESSGTAPSVAARSATDADDQRAVALMESVSPAATLDQKLQAGASVEAIRTHPFAHEPVRLQVVVHSASLRDAVAAGAASYLADQQAVDLRQALADVKRDLSADDSFFFEGAPEINFAAPGQRQLLIRAPRSHVARLVEHVARRTGRSEAITLSAGPLTLHGLQPAQLALGELAASRDAGLVAAASKREQEVQDTSMVAEDNDAALPAEKPDAWTDGMVDWLRAIGLSPELLTPPEEPASKLADAASTADRSEQSPDRAESGARFAARSPASKTGPEDAARFDDRPDAQPTASESAKRTDTTRDVHPVPATRTAIYRLDKQDAEADSPSGATAGAGPQEPTTLVERKSAEIRLRRATGRTASAQTGAASAVAPLRSRHAAQTAGPPAPAETPDDTIVTLVLEIAVKAPEPTKGAHKSRPVSSKKEPPRPAE